MTARAEIENALYRYAWAFDMNEPGEMDACFASDAECLFPDGGLRTGREAVVAELGRRRSLYARGDTPWHVISNVFIRSESSTEATVVSFWTFFVAGTGGPVLRSAGLYEDQFVNRDGAWQIARRAVRPASSA